MLVRNFLSTAQGLFNQIALPALMDYVRIPNCSPNFPQFHSVKETANALTFMFDFALTQTHIPGIRVEVRNPERVSSPLLCIDIPATPGKEHLDTVVLYGHGDKQPPFEGWSEGLSPYEPTLKGDKLYGRGCADDAYAIFTSLIAMSILHEQGVPYARTVIIIEFGEESGSPDLPFYMDELKEQLGKVGMIICLDSGCGNYDQLFVTTNLRGLVTGTLRVDVLKQGVHSGDAGGIVPSPFDLISELLNSIRDPFTGRILLPALQAQIPQERREQNEKLLGLLGDAVITDLPFVDGARALGSPAQVLPNNLWAASVAVIGQRGLPEIGSAGNTMIPYLEVELAIRVPPTIDVNVAAQAVHDVLTGNGCLGKVTFTLNKKSPGWNANSLAPLLHASLENASMLNFGAPMVYQGQAGTIPFMQMLQKAYPDADQVVTGLLGPGSNAHGADESLDIPAAGKLTACVANVLADYAD